MFSELKKHKVDYSFLAVIASVFVFLFLAKRNESSYLLLLTLCFALAYILWGVWHHSRTHSLSLRVVLEYLLVGTLGILIVATLLV